MLVAADSGNGVSAELDYHRYLFINTELTVHLTREPEGEWVCLDAVTRTGPQGVGLSESVLADTRGRFGRSAQTLLRARAMRRSATCFMPPRTVHLRWRRRRRAGRDPTPRASGTPRLFATGVRHPR